jgi:ferredoxin-NADP reductase
VDGGDLPAIRAGAHLDVPVALPSGVHTTRRYSISSNPTRRDAYEIAVLHEPQGQGGSAAIHASFELGMVLHCGVPANDFALADSDGPVLLVAAGIGITPIKAMALELLAKGREFELHYAYRSRTEAAYLDRLARQIGHRLVSYDASANRKLDAVALLQSAPAGSHIYVCGPARLIEALQRAAHQQGLSSERVHHEAFALDTAHQGHPFVVKLAKQEKNVWVPTHMSLLQALENAGCAVPSGCRTGSCGSCVTPVRAGAVAHRDSFLTPAQRASGQMCVCVSRAQGDALELDL